MPGCTDCHRFRRTLRPRALFLHEIRKANAMAGHGPQVVEQLLELLPPADAQDFVYVIEAHLVQPAPVPATRTHTSRACVRAGRRNEEARWRWCGAHCKPESCSAVWGSEPRHADVRRGCPGTTVTTAGRPRLRPLSREERPALIVGPLDARRRPQSPVPALRFPLSISLEASYIIGLSRFLFTLDLTRYRFLYPTRQRR